MVFVALHGVSMIAFYVIRSERDRSRIETLLSASARTVVPMYVSLVAVVVSGVFLAAKISAFRRSWPAWSIVILVALTIFMWVTAKPIHRRILAACEVRPSGVPRVADEDLPAVLRTWWTHAVTLVGVAGLGYILYLMTFKPF